MPRQTHATRSRLVLPLVSLISVAMAALACNIGAQPPVATATSASSNTTLVAQSDVPEVEIRSPADNSEVIINTEVQVYVRAVDKVGVTRIEMRVDNLIVDTAASPDANGTPSMDSILSWTPNSDGPHVLQVVAFRGNVQGNPKQITLVVRDNAAQVTHPAGSPQFLTASPTSNPACRVRVNTDNLNVRTGPGINYDRITTLSVGSEVPVTGSTSDRSWYQVDVQALSGWVSGFYVTQLGICSNLQNVPVPSSPTAPPGATAFIIPPTFTPLPTLPLPTPSSTIPIVVLPTLTWTPIPPPGQPSAGDLSSTAIFATQTKLAQPPPTATQPAQPTATNVPGVTPTITLTPSFTPTPLLPNLVINSVATTSDTVILDPVQKLATVPFVIDVANVGDAPAPVFQIAAVLPDGTAVVGKTTAILQAKAATQITLNVTFTKAGTQRVTVIADSGNVVVESNKTDNVAFRDVNVVVATAVAPTATSTNTLTAVPPTATFTSTVVPATAAATTQATQAATSVAPSKTSTSTPTDTPTAVPPTATHTVTVVPATATATAQATQAATSVAPTKTLTPTATLTPTVAVATTAVAIVPTKTLTPTPTFTVAVVPPTATHTFTPSPVPPTATHTFTPSPVPPTATHTFTPSPVPPTATHTFTPSPVPPTATHTFTPSPVPPTATHTFTPSPVPPTATHTFTPSPVPPTATHTFTPSPVPPTATPTTVPPTKTFTPTAVPPTAAPTIQIVDMMTVPIVPDLTNQQVLARIKQINDAGKKSGANPGEFKLVGDQSLVTMTNIADPNSNLNKIQQFAALVPIAQTYSGSFTGAPGPTNGANFTSADILKPSGACQNKTPLDCALTANPKPAVVFIDVGRNDLATNAQTKQPNIPLDQFQANLTNAVNAAAGQGVIPVLVTITGAANPADEARVAQYNNVIFQVADAAKVPLFNVYAVKKDNPATINPTNGTLSDPGQGKRADYSPQGLAFGINDSDLHLLELLNALKTAVPLQ